MLCYNNYKINLLQQSLSLYFKSSKIDTMDDPRIILI